MVSDVKRKGLNLLQNSKKVRIMTISKMSAKKNYVVHVRIDIGKATMYEYCTSLNQSTETRQNYAIQIQIQILIQILLRDGLIHVIMIKMIKDLL